MRELTSDLDSLQQKVEAGEQLEVIKGVGLCREHRDEGLVLQAEFFVVGDRRHGVLAAVFLLETFF